MMSQHAEDLSDRARLVSLLAARGLNPIKQRGQHFLVDRRVIDRLAAAILEDGPVPIFEIGPGLGALTGPLLAAGREVVAVELDHGLAAYLEETWGTASLTVIEADALKLDWGAWWQVHRGRRPVLLAGNLPYYITGPLVARLWEDRLLPWERAVLMVQKEAADRLLAEPGTRQTGLPAVLLRTVGQPRRLFDVPAGAYYPVPEVASAVVEVRRTDHWPSAVRDALAPLVRAGFGQRRKTLRRALGTVIQDASAWMAEAAVDPGRRAESLSMDDWRRLAEVARSRSAGLR